MNKLDKIKKHTEEFYSDKRDDRKVKINAYTELRSDDYKSVWYINYKTANFTVNADREYGLKYLDETQTKEFNEFMKSNQPGIQWDGFVGSRAVI